MVTMPRALAQRDAELARLQNDLAVVTLDRDGLKGALDSAAQLLREANAEVARVNHDRRMLRRENTALLTTNIGQLQCRNDELAAEVLDLKAKLAALGVTV